MLQQTILVIDDNEQNLALAQAALEDEGFRVVLASRGQDGVDLVASERPDCVLLDVRMPGMSGVETCKAIRALPGAEDLPIVFLTAQRDLETFEETLAAGGDDYLTKPVQPAALVVRVRAALRVRSLSSELQEYYELVRHQRDALLRLNLQKERLSSFVVHDLKNPINAMDLHAQLLLRDSSLSERARDSAQRIRSEGRALLRLVLNLLDISRSEEGALTPRTGHVDLDEMAKELLEEFEAKVRTAGVCLEAGEKLPQVTADVDLLKRVLENLIDNAIRHAPKGSTVTLFAERVPATDDDPVGVEIRVADAGPGIAVEMRDRVFDRFVQAESDSMVSRAGRGLGLTFCRLAAEAHGGRIWVADAQPGAVFVVRLPV